MMSLREIPKQRRERHLAIIMIHMLYMRALFTSLCLLCMDCATYFLSLLWFICFKINSLSLYKKFQKKGRKKHFLLILKIWCSFRAFLIAYVLFVLAVHFYFFFF